MRKPRKKYSISFRDLGITVFCITLLFILWVFLSFYKTGKLHVKNESIDPSNAIQIGIGFVAAGVGILAAVLAYRSLRLTQKAEEGALYIDMMKRYTDKEMVEAIRLLVKFHRQEKSAYVTAFENWKKYRETDPEKVPPEEKTVAEESVAIEKARHTVKYFYRDLMQLVQANYFSEELAKRICNTGGRHVFKKIVLPMDEVMNSFSFPGEYDPFEKIYHSLNEEQKYESDLSNSGKI